MVTVVWVFSFLDKVFYTCQYVIIVCVFNCLYVRVVWNAELINPTRTVVQ